MILLSDVYRYTLIRGSFCYVLGDAFYVGSFIYFVSYRPYGYGFYFSPLLEPPKRQRWTEDLCSDTKPVYFKEWLIASVVFFLGCRFDLFWLRR